MKRIPQRTCIACRNVKPKPSLTRVVCAPQGGVAVDETGRANGRGAYLCRNRQCWLKAIGVRPSGSGTRLAAALHTTIADEEWTALWEYAEQLPDSVDEKTDVHHGGIGGKASEALGGITNEPVPRIPDVD